MPSLPALIGEKIVSTGGQFVELFTPTTNTIVKAAAGRLCRVILSTANGANPVLFYDSTNPVSPGSKVIGYVPASAALGTVYDFQIPAYSGIVIPAVVGAATMNVTFD